MANRAYLDWNATTPLCSEARAWYRKKGGAVVLQVGPAARQLSSML